MKKLFFTIFIIFAFALGAYAQPVNEPQYIACDTITDPSSVDRSVVEANGNQVVSELCLYDPQNGYTFLLNVTGYQPGPYSIRAMVWGVTTIDPDTGETVVGKPSGWSNTLTVSKPAILVLRYEGGYIVCDPQPDIATIELFINESVSQALNEPSGNIVRLIHVDNLPENASVYARAIHVSNWKGNWTVNPFIVSTGTAPLPPAALRLTD